MMALGYQRKTELKRREEMEAPCLGCGVTRKRTRFHCCFGEGGGSVFDYSTCKRETLVKTKH